MTVLVSLLNLLILPNHLYKPCSDSLLHNSFLPLVSNDCGKEKREVKLTLPLIDWIRIMILAKNLMCMVCK